MYAFLDTALDRKHFDVARAVVAAAAPVLRKEMVNTFVWEIEKEESQAKVLEVMMDKSDVVSQDDLLKALRNNARSANGTPAPAPTRR